MIPHYRNPHIHLDNEIPHFAKDYSYSSTSPSSSSSPFDSRHSDHHHQIFHQRSITYTTCDVVTRHLIHVLLSISDWTNDLAKQLGGNKTHSEATSSDDQNERCHRFSSVFYEPPEFIVQMSSVASKQALLLALGGISIAALFVWYIKKKDNDDREKKKKANELVSNGTRKITENGIQKKVTQNGHANGGVVQK
uniref:Col_cuticle_N domain-containing protein n=1 Tax=Caenorhabditis tropicalis TaxID=1561998 RepID=A0A1I7U923_9PELO